MLIAIDTPQNAFPNPNAVELDEMTMLGFPQRDDHITTDDIPVVSSSQTTPKKKGKISKEGKEVWEMTSDELQEVNSKWVYWMDKLQHTIRRYAWGDEDLTQFGIINLRRTLYEDINAPPEHLLHRAKLAIWVAASKGRSVDSPKSKAHNKRDRKGGIKLIYTDGYDNPYDNPLVADKLKYQPEVLAVDHVAYEDFRASLTDEESTLLDIMVSIQNNGKKGPAGFKKAFIRETGSTYSNYEAVNMSLLQKFYYHYGTDKQQENFERFYAHWRPRQPMYHGLSKPCEETFKEEIEVKNERLGRF